MRREPITDDCDICGGSGWRRSSLYPDPCDNCIGGQMLVGWREVGVDVNCGRTEGEALARALINLRNHFMKEKS